MNNFFFEIQNYTMEWLIKKNKERTKVVAWRCFIKIVFLKFFKIHRKATVPECQRPATLFKKRDSGTGVFL